MGGHLAVESPASGVASAPEKVPRGALTQPRSPGSRFYFTARFGLAPEDTSDHGEPIDLRGLPVLIVDDNATNRLILSEMLSSWHMKPVAVEGARQALQELPGGQSERLNRIRWCCSIRRCRRWTASPWPSRSSAQPELAGDTIMMLVSSDRQGSSERCRDVGIRACLMKPLKQSELLNTILDLLSTEQVIAPCRADEPSLETPASVRVERPLRVLLAEDNIVNQRLAMRILEKRGHTARLGQQRQGGAGACWNASRSIWC